MGKQLAGEAAVHPPRRDMPSALPLPIVIVGLDPTIHAEAPKTGIPAARTAELESDPKRRLKRFGMGCRVKPDND
jgi:hypothetical protein